MKTAYICILIIVCILSFLVGLAGCTTGPFRLQITPMKVEINAPEKPIVPVIPAPVELILK